MNEPRGDGRGPEMRGVTHHMICDESCERAHVGQPSTADVGAPSLLSLTSLL